MTNDDRLLEMEHNERMKRIATDAEVKIATRLAIAAVFIALFMSYCAMHAPPA